MAVTRIVANLDAPEPIFTASTIAPSHDWPFVFAQHFNCSHFVVADRAAS